MTTTPISQQLIRGFGESQTGWRLVRSQQEALEWVQAQPGDVGWTWAVALIAETGTAVLSDAAGQARASSLCVLHHVVLVRCADIHPTLEAFLTGLQDPSHLHDQHGHLTFITGPSRTADIEKQLVVPAHGPARVDVLLVDSAEERT